MLVGPLAVGGTKVLLVPDPPTAAVAAAAATAGDAALGFPAVFVGDDVVGVHAADADTAAATIDARAGMGFSSSSFSLSVFSAKSESVTTCAFSPWRGSNGSTVRWSIFFSLTLADFSPKMYTT